MQLKQNYITHKVDKQWLMLFTSDDPEDFHGILRFNDTGKFILDRLAAETTYDELLAGMQEAFDGDEAEMKADLDEALENLRQAGALDE